MRARANLDKHFGLNVVVVDVGLDAVDEVLEGVGGLAEVAPEAEVEGPVEVPPRPRVLEAVRAQGVAVGRRQLLLHRPQRDVALLAHPLGVLLLPAHRQHRLLVGALLAEDEPAQATLARASRS